MNWACENSHLKFEEKKRIDILNLFGCKLDKNEEYDDFKTKQSAITTKENKTNNNIVRRNNNNRIRINNNSLMFFIHNCFIVCFSDTPPVPLSLIIEFNIRNEKKHFELNTNSKETIKSLKEKIKVFFINFIKEKSEGITDDFLLYFNNFELKEIADDLKYRFCLNVNEENKEIYESDKIEHLSGWNSDDLVLVNGDGLGRMFLVACLNVRGKIFKVILDSSDDV